MNNSESLSHFILKNQLTHEINSNDMYNIIQSLNFDKGSGLDGIHVSCKLLKEAAPVITPSLTFIINLSTSSCIFPDDWKIVKVTALFKEGSKSDPNNYRPISVLLIVSKLILEDYLQPVIIIEVSMVFF